jgi:hypothetical protein
MALECMDDFLSKGYGRNTMLILLRNVVFFRWAAHSSMKSKIL